VRRGLRPSFGGENYDRLFLITGSAGYSSEKWVEEPLAGGLFEILAPSASGLPIVAFPG